MRKSILITFLLCFLSTQVLGSVAYKNDHKAQGDVHSFMHELDQPHTHDYEDESKFTLSYTSEAIEHINQDADCCVIGLIDTSVDNLSERKPIGAVNWPVNNWSPPFLRHIKPPPRD